jgi:hypothetical protein
MKEGEGTGFMDIPDKIQSAVHESKHPSERIPEVVQQTAGIWHHHVQCKISGFCCGVNEIFTLLECYAAEICD